MVSLTCGVSLLRAAKIIALVDLVCGFIFMVFSSAIEIVQIVRYVEIPVNHTAIKANISTFPPSTATENIGEHEISVKLSNVFFVVTFIMILSVAYIIFELWMCRLLTGAAKNLDKEKCMRWLSYRFSITIVIILMCVVKTFAIRLGWLDWILEVEAIYRIYELLIVYKFITEMDAISSRVRISNYPEFLDMA